MKSKELDEAIRQVDECIQLVAEQRARIAELERRGHDTTGAKELLQVLEQTLVGKVEHQYLVAKGSGLKDRESTKVPD